MVLQGHLGLLGGVMKELFIVMIACFYVSTGFAGGSSFFCENSAKTISFSTIEEGYMGELVINYIMGGENLSFKSQAMVNPAEPLGLRSELELNIMARGKALKGFENCEQVHIRQPDGSECHGSEVWLIETQRRYFLSTKKGAVKADTLLGRGSEFAGRSSNGEIVDDFKCVFQGFTTSGGCYYQEGSNVEWVKIPCN